MNLKRATVLRLPLLEILSDYLPDLKKIILGPLLHFPGIDISYHWIFGRLKVKIGEEDSGDNEAGNDEYESKRNNFFARLHQVNHEAGLMVNNTGTLDVTTSGYGAYHKGPGTDGKGFFSNELGVKVSDTFKVACYSVDVTSQGMSQAMTTAGNAGAGASAQGGAVAGASAGGVSGGVQGQATTYQLGGMHGGGVQLMGTASYVNVNTSAH